MMTEARTSARERIQQEAAGWHVRLTSGSAGADTEAEFEHWRAQSVEHDQAYRDISRLWQQLPGPLLADRQRRQQRAAKRRAFTVNRCATSLACAASLLLIVVAGFFPDYLSYPLADYRTRIGERQTVRLSDGSIVYLNTDSAIDVAYDVRERKIVLRRGEAEFEVAHDGGRPFRVVSGATTTEALGTRFVVRYDGKAGEVSLFHGTVSSSRLAQGHMPYGQVILQAGQQVAFSDEGVGAVHAFETNGADAWKRGRLAMNFVPLKQVIAEINRYRRVQIKLLNEDLGEREVNIAVDLEHVDDWLLALQQSVRLKIIKAGPWVFLQA